MLGKLKLNLLRNINNMRREICMVPTYVSCNYES